MWAADRARLEGRHELVEPRSPRSATRRAMPARRRAGGGCGEVEVGEPRRCPAATSASRSAVVGERPGARRRPRWPAPCVEAAGRRRPASRAPPSSRRRRPAGGGAWPRAAARRSPRGRRRHEHVGRLGSGRPARRRSRRRRSRRRRRAARRRAEALEGGGVGVRRRAADEPQPGVAGRTPAGRRRTPSSGRAGPCWARPGPRTATSRRSAGAQPVDGRGVDAAGRTSSRSSRIGTTAVAPVAERDRARPRCRPSRRAPSSVARARSPSWRRPARSSTPTCGSHGANSGPA